MNFMNKLKAINISDVFSSLIKGSSQDKKYKEELHILLKAMINASKCDGIIDSKEQEKIIEFMGKISMEEKLFVKREMQTPLNSEEFLKEIPKGMERQVYYMSLFAIDLDVEAERDYLEMLEKKLNLTKDEISNIHDDLGVSALI